jgi:hypothetical protein
MQRTGGDSSGPHRDNKKPKHAVRKRKKPRTTNENPVDPVSSCGQRFSVKRGANGAIETRLLSFIDLQAVLLLNDTPKP